MYSFLENQLKQPVLDEEEKKKEEAKISGSVCCFML